MYNVRVVDSYKMTYSPSSQIGHAVTVVIKWKHYTNNKHMHETVQWYPNKLRPEYVR